MKISVGQTAGTILLAVALAPFAVGAADAKPTLKVIAKGAILKGGGGKIAYAQVSATKPRSVSARVKVTPAQKVKLSYSVVCSKGTAVNNEGYNETTQPSTGVVTTMAPVLKKLPISIANPTTCSISVYSQLFKAGKQTLEVLQG